MSKILLSLALIWVLGSNFSVAQTTSSFDDLNLNSNSYWNGSDLSGGFISGNAFFVNNYDTAFYSWTGFAYSTIKDTLTPNYTNMYSAITAAGQSGEAYGVAYISSYGGPTYLTLRNAAVGKEVNGFFITNSTYAFLSMRDGDAISKKFGGSSGNDPDWFKLKILGYLNGNLVDTTNFYLADFRDVNNANDYIVKDWTWVDLTVLGNVDSLSFELSSSDVGAWGMNTPSYFCMDELVTSDGVGMLNPFTQDFQLKVYPNPAVGHLNVSLSSLADEIKLIDMSGRVVRHVVPKQLNTQLDISSLSKGIYFLQITVQGQQKVQKIVKR
jgi:hypothetical protein